MKPPIFKVVTINLLKDLSQWEARRTLLIQGLIALGPDLIALQEVALPQNNSQWIAEALNQALPDPHNTSEYASDHFGLSGTFEIII